MLQILQYGGISALAIFLMYKITSNGLQSQKKELMALRSEIIKLRETIERLITRLDERLYR